MALIIKNNTKDLDSVFQILKEKYPDLKINKENKSTVVVLKSKITTVIRIKGDKLSIYGDINLKNALNLAFIIIGILVGIVGVIFVFAILRLVYNKQIKAFKSDVYITLA
jgi:hypothetical protein